MHPSLVADERKTAPVHARPAADIKEADPLLGAVLESRYKLLRRLGSGGMSTVYLAQNLSFDGYVAVKFIRPRVTSTREVMSRCMLEAKALASIPSNFIVRAHDVRTLPNGQIYIVMEYLEGEDLGALVRREGPIPWRRAAKMIRMVCAGLAAAHKRQLLHRDIKPQNCLRVTLDDDPDHIKLIDFGIAKEVNADHEITETGMILGTPEYMAPELMDERCQPDPRSDLYAVGITLYKLLTGVVPFTGRNPLEICARHSNDPVVPPSQRSPDLHIPAAADLIVLRALAKHPAQRYQTAIAMIRDIEATLARSPTGPLPTLRVDSGDASSASLPVVVSDAGASTGPTRTSPRPHPATTNPVAAAVPPAPRLVPAVSEPNAPRRPLVRDMPPIAPAPRRAPPSLLPTTSSASSTYPPLADPLAPRELPEGRRAPRITEQYKSPGSSSGPTLPIVPAPPTPPTLPAARVVRTGERLFKLLLPALLAALLHRVTGDLAASIPDIPPPPPQESVRHAAPAAPERPPASEPPPAPASEPPPAQPSEPLVVDPATTPPPADVPPAKPAARAPARPAVTSEPDPRYYATAARYIAEQRGYLTTTCLVPHGFSRLGISVVIAWDGRLRSVALDNPSPAIRDCVTKLLKNTVFPRSPRGAAFTYDHPTGHVVPQPLADRKQRSP